MIPLLAALLGLAAPAAAQDAPPGFSVTYLCEGNAVLQVAYEGVSVEDDEQRRKNILAYFQGLTAFNRLQEAVELEARLAALERLMEHSPNGQVR